MREPWKILILAAVIGWMSYLLWSHGYSTGLKDERQSMQEKSFAP